MNLVQFIIENPTVTTFKLCDDCDGLEYTGEERSKCTRCNGTGIESA